MIRGCEGWGMSACSTEPVVSVMLPVFNSEAHLAQAIDSILNQSYVDFEVIAVDDGSTDWSPAILERYERTDRRMRVFRRPRSGISETLNFAGRQSRGGFLARMDSDDVSLPQRFAEQLDFLSDRPECVAVGTQVYQIDAGGARIAPLPVCVTHSEIEEQLLEGRGTAIVHPSVMIRRADFEAVGGYDSRFDGSEDLDLYLRLAERGVLANLANVLLLYRRHSASVTALSRLDEVQRRKRHIIREAHRRRGIPNAEVRLREFFHPTTEAELYLMWAYSAFQAGNYKTALKYGTRMFRNSWNDVAFWRHLGRSAVHWAARLVDSARPASNVPAGGLSVHDMPTSVE